MGKGVNVVTEGAKTYIEGIERLGWKRGEMCEFAMAFTRMLTCVGEQVPYPYVMGVTGVAFRFTFGPEHWNPGFYGFGAVSADTRDLIRRAFEAVGYEYDEYEKGDPDEDLRRITGSIDAGVAVMLKGCVVDASDWVIITGHDSESGALLGSSPYGGGNMFKDMDVIEERIGNMREYIVLGGKRERPPAETIYADALRLAANLVRTPSIADHATGLAAYEALASVLRDEAFPEEATRQEDQPGFRYLCLLCYNMMLDDHKSAAPFLRDAAEVLPKGGAELGEAAERYNRSGELRDSLEGILPSNFSQEAQKRVLDPEVREEFAKVLIEIRDIEEAGISGVERALAAIGT